MWIWSSSCTSKVLLRGKTALITGGNTGIGKETAKDFYSRGARVIVACRDVTKAEKAVEEISAECSSDNGGSLLVQQLDLADLRSVRACAERVLKTESHLHLLINNAGVMFAPERNTPDGVETHFAVNHLGHFLLTLLLLPKIIESKPARIVTVASLAHTLADFDLDDLDWKRRTFRHISAYGQSKLANVLFSRELSRRLEQHGITDVTTYSLHPGVIHTELGRNLGQLIPGLRTVWRLLGSWWLKTPKQGAQTTIHCAVSEEAGQQTGLYYNECKVTNSSALARDDKLAEKLWDVSVKMTGLEGYDPFKTVANITKDDSK